jgi:hypothetical protein
MTCYSFSFDFETPQTWRNIDHLTKVAYFQATKLRSPQLILCLVTVHQGHVTSSHYNPGFSKDHVTSSLALVAH